MATVFLALGSNVGDREKAIRQALQALEGEGINIVLISSLIETKPEGGPPQGKFLNSVIQVETGLLPEELLICIKTIEQALGRTPSVRNGPRVIDIDILLYDDIEWHSPRLDIPHPRMKSRPFVMIPLAEIAPDLARRLGHEDHHTG
ncbi:MAG TPA: 2-amino-4-hydroxy-6-hydroxymethyldihydropteridine diphosphokinase [Candidatus Omnitrophota bacterium]|nr:2-amino-4-hydroxy-6-hydroxymethyldihydropteridine diphosphokinase [Candidatus Omnitrophota bacterium]HQO58054.1 2-amino-4-hydroxy-6-hydroxymethyldihydropteridine diphosphokinase [Candidatus Omnitrophota bacterium]HQP12076.1 2-amino-4-hydroxy-6-hydroxymethyldihydropteridine diphosphokinase [Candidatus Omnitrophota bacterium]